MKRLAALVRGRKPPRRVAGVDEAGRGPLAGPVVAAAVILDPRRPIRGLADSKVRADRDEIDAINILQATYLAMRRALLRLPVCPTHIQVDGNRLPRYVDLGFGCTAEAIVDGDATVNAISAASILAKTYRDAMMRHLDVCYPGFGLASHKGYSTPAHIEALRSRPPSPIHRRSFSPVRLSGSATIGGSGGDESAEEVLSGDAVNTSL